MATVTTETLTKDLTAIKAKRLSERIADQVVKLDAEQGTLRKLLVDFNDGNGWKALGYNNWEGWAKKVLPQSRSMIFRQLSAGQHEKALGMDIGSTPESHLRGLGKVPVEKRQGVFDAADKAAQDAGRPMQASDVRAAADEVTAVNPPIVDGAATVVLTKPVDAVGVEIPEHLLAVFGNARAPFDEGMRLLSQLKTLVTEMAGGEASHFIGAQLASLEQDRLNMYHAVKFGRPFAVCPYCKGKKKNCTACGDPKTGKDPVGWVNELIWKESPVGKKAEAKAKEADKAKA